MGSPPADRRPGSSGGRPPPERGSPEEPSLLTRGVLQRLEELATEGRAVGTSNADDPCLPSRPEAELQLPEPDGAQQFLFDLQRNIEHERQAIAAQRRADERMPQAGEAAGAEAAAEEESTSPTSPTSPTSLTSPTLSRVWRADDAKFWPQPLAPRGYDSPEAQKGARRRDSLKELRRVRRTSGDAADDAPNEPPEKEENQEEALIYATLRDLLDNSESLGVLENQLEQGLSPVKESGGARHATAVISSRTLAVVQRKKSLLLSVEMRVEKLVARQLEFDALVPALAAGELKEAPAELRGIKKFLERHTHSPGDPADANKSDFKAFASSFKLPYWHSRLATLRSLMGEVGEWWADACLGQAERGAAHQELERLFDVATGTGIERDHPKLVRAKRILSDRLADRVLSEAQDLFAKDEKTAAQQKCPPVGPASTAAAAIEASMLRAIADGVPEKDRRLADAKDIVRKLREADATRKRLAHREIMMKAKRAAQVASALGAGVTANADGGGCE